MAAIQVGIIAPILGALLLVAWIIGLIIIAIYVALRWAWMIETLKEPPE